MATLAEVQNKIIEVTKHPSWKGMSAGEQNVRLEKMLSTSPEYANLGMAEQSLKLYETKVAVGMMPGEQDLGGTGRALQFGMENVGPMVAGAVGSRFGGPGLGAAAAGMAGQVAEFTRQPLTGEPMRPLQEQAIRRGVDVGGELAFPALVGSMRATRNMTQAAVNRWLRGLGPVEAAITVGEQIAQKGRKMGEAFRKGRDIHKPATEESKSASKVLGEEGMMLYQKHHPGDKLGVRGLMHELAYGAQFAPHMVDRVARGQMSASQAYIDNLGASFTREADGPAAVAAMRGMILDRTAMARGIESGLFSQVDNLSGGYRPDITEVVGRTAGKYGDISRIREVLEPIMPEAYRGVKAAGAADSGMLKEGIEQATGPLTLSVSGTLDRISKLRELARTAKGENAESVKRVATAMANQLDQTLDGLPAEARAALQTAREFTKMNRTTLSNKAVTSFLYNLSQTQSDNFLNMMLGPQRSDDMLKLKTALSEPIKAPDGTVISGMQGMSLWESKILPAIKEKLLEKSSVGMGRDVFELSGEKLKQNLRGFSKQQIDTMLGQGAYDGLVAVSDALTVAQKRPGGRGLLSSIQRYAAIGTAVGAGTTLASEEGQIEDVGKRVATFSLLGMILPTAYAKYMIDPTFAKTLAKGIRNSGTKAGAKALAGTFERIAGRVATEGLVAARVRETLDELQGHRQTAY